MWMLPLYLHVNQKSDYDIIRNVFFTENRLIFQDEMSKPVFWGKKIINLLSTEFVLRMVHKVELVFEKF